MNPTFSLKEPRASSLNKALLALFLAGLIVLEVVFGLRGWRPDWPAILAAVLGSAVGFGELVSRYRDAPLRAIRTRPAVLYLAVNAVAALIALVMIRFLDVKFGVSDPAATNRLEWVRALAAGFSAMALFRSALFVVRVGDQDVGIGPVSFLQVVLDTSDRAVDRLRAESRANFVASLMKGVSFARAQKALPTLCLALMQNLPKEDQERLGRAVGDLADAAIDDRIKGSILGLALLTMVGEEVLAAAVESLGARIHSIHRVEVSPTQVTLGVGQMTILIAKAFDEGNTELTGCDFTWTSTNPAVVAVTSNGAVTGITPGTVQLSAVIDKGTGASSITVT